MQLSVLQELMQIHLLSIDQSGLCMELRPRPPCADRTSELDPLRLRVTWSRDHFTLQVPNSCELIPRLEVLEHGRPPPCTSKVGVSCVQVSDVTGGLVEDRVSGRRAELSAALLEVMQRYLSQFQLLSEIQGLRSRCMSTPPPPPASALVSWFQLKFL